jgi:ferrochelatase
MSAVSAASAASAALSIVGQPSPVAATAAERTAVVLINVGTPDDPSTSSVRRYLRQFLSDPRVLDINPVARWFLLRAIILPFRSPKSAAMYRTIWTERGSPLLVHSNDLAAKLRARLQLQDTGVFVAMRYGAPSMPSVVDELRRGGFARVVLVPMFPQYASASTGTALAEMYRLLGELARVPDVRVVSPFYDDAGFIDNVASTIVEATKSGGAPDHLLLSYHSIPVHQVKNIHPATCANSDACCAQIDARNADCYRAQCVATSRALLAALRARGFMAPVSTSFQSRLGRAEWLTPNTEHAVDALAKSGVKRLAIACPSFVADCLETVEEIGVRAKEQFLAAGGTELVAIPCVNADDGFADTVARLVERARG